MAAGLPVVCSPVGHNLEVVEDGVTGLFASGEQEWVDALEQLVEDAPLRARLGASGRVLVEARHALPLQAQRLATIVKRAHTTRGGTGEAR